MGHSHSHQRAKKLLSDDELAVLEATYRDLSRRYNCRELPKHVFLRIFRVGGIIGDRLFKIFDLDSDDAISFAEFRDGFAQFYKGTLDDKFGILFRMFDVDADGYIMRDELQLLLNSLFVPTMGGEADSSHTSSTKPGAVEAKGEDSAQPSVSTTPSATISTSTASSTAIPPPSYDESSISDSQGDSTDDTGIAQQSSSGSLRYVKAILDETFAGCSPSEQRMDLIQFRTFVSCNYSVSKALDAAFKLHVWMPTIAGNGLNLTQSPQSQADNRYADARIDEKFARAHAARAQPLFLVPDANTGADAIAAATAAAKGSKHIASPKSGSSQMGFQCKTCGWVPKFCIQCGDPLVLSETKALKCSKHSQTPLRCCMTCGEALSLTAISHDRGGVLDLDDVSLAESKSSRDALDYDGCGGLDAPETDEDDFELIDAPEGGRDVGVPAWGTLYQLGTGFWKWQDRWAICRQNFLYVFNESYRYGRTMPRPRTVIFLEGCQIRLQPRSYEGYYGLEVIAPYAPSNDNANTTGANTTNPVLSTAPPGSPISTHSPGQTAALAMVASKTAGPASIAGSTSPNSAALSGREGYHVFYFSTEESRAYWQRVLTRAAKISQFHDLYTMGRMLGQGKFSTVYEARNKTTNELFAVKVIDKGASQKSAADLEAIRCEIAIMKLVKHPFIVQMKDVFDSPGHLHIVMQLTKDDLFDRIHKKRIFPERTARQLVYNLLKGVSYLHSLGIVHRDLKPENILCTDEDDDTKIVIADFGLSQFVGPNEVMQIACGTINYVAPEVLRMQGYGKNVDAWSIGMIAYVLLYGMLPFYNQDKSITVQNTLHKPLTFGRHVKITASAMSFLTDMLQKDPTKRMTVEAALHHQWFKEPDVPAQVVPAMPGQV